MCLLSELTVPLKGGPAASKSASGAGRFTDSGTPQALSLGTPDHHCLSVLPPPRPLGRKGPLTLAAVSTLSLGKRELVADYEVILAPPSHTFIEDFPRCLGFPKLKDRVSDINNLAGFKFLHEADLMGSLSRGHSPWWEPSNATYSCLTAEKTEAQKSSVTHMHSVGGNARSAPRSSFRSFATTL